MIQGGFVGFLGAKNLTGGLRLDRRETLRRGEDSGPAIIPGRVDQSLLIETVRYESVEMPPKASCPNALLQTWSSGSRWERQTRGPGNRRARQKRR